MSGLLRFGAKYIFIVASYISGNERIEGHVYLSTTFNAAVKQSILTARYKLKTHFNKHDQTCFSHRIFIRVWYGGVYVVLLLTNYFKEKQHKNK